MMLDSLARIGSSVPPGASSRSRASLMVAM